MKLSATSLRLRRSVHFVPGPNERMLQKSLDSNADSLVLDLEDAVTSKNKKRARAEIATWLEEVDFGSKEVTVRINPLDTPWGLEDLRLLMAYPPHALVVPKPQRLTDLELLDTLMLKYETANGSTLYNVKLIPIVNETPLGTINIPSLAKHPRIVGLTWGAEDLATAIGGTTNRDEAGAFLSLYDSCRNNVLLAANANNVDPLDTVFVNLTDRSGLQRECESAAQLGFTGKLTIHPEQIDVVNEAFTPSMESINRATRLIEAFAEAHRDGTNAFRFEGQMVDAPHLNQAKAIIKRAKLAGVN